MKPACVFIREQLRFLCLNMQTQSACLIPSVLYWPCQRDAELSRDRQPVGSFGFSWVPIFICLLYFKAQHMLFVFRAISVLLFRVTTAQFPFWCEALFHSFTKKRSQEEKSLFESWNLTWCQSDKVTSSSATLFPVNLLLIDGKYLPLTLMSHSHVGKHWQTHVFI